MGKLTGNDVETLKKEGILSATAIKEMEDKGLVTSRRKSNKKYIKTANGKLVSPLLYFQGIGKDKYSKRMVELRDEFNSLVSKYAIKQPTKK